MTKEASVATCQFDILCFASAYWDEQYWTNQHYHMDIVSSQHRVLYIEPGLSVWGCLRGWKRLQHPWQRLFPYLKRVHSQLYLFYLPVLPGTNIPVIETINQWFLESMLKLVTMWLHFQHPLVWFYHPQYVALLKKLQPVKLICYDCVDEFSEYPSFAKVKQKIFHMEQELIRKADVVFTTSEHLYHSRRSMNVATYYLPNAADVEHFQKARLAEMPIPDDIRQLAAPVIGFVGAVSVYKLDVELLQFVAEKHPDWQIVLIGIIGEGEAQTNLGQLPDYPNVHFFGHREYETLPGYLKKFDVCIIPYQINAYTQGVFPMKFFEYMATGKPIVTTALPALREFAKIVKIAHSPQEFVAAIAEVLHDDPTQGQRLEEVPRHTWEARTMQILNIITERLQTTLNNREN